MSDGSSRRDADLQGFERVLQLGWLIFGHDRMLVQVPQPLAEHFQGTLDIARFELPKQNVSMSLVGSSQAIAQSTHRDPISLSLSAMVMY